LLNHLFDGHPQLVVNSHESRYFTHFVQGFPEVRNDPSKLEVLLKESLMRVWDPGHSFYRRYLSALSTDELWSKFWDILQKRGGQPHNYLEASVLAFGAVSGQLREGVEHWVEKTPNTEHFTDQLFQAWPEAKCIHVIRDPRDVHATLRRRADIAFSPRTTVHNWRRSFDRAQENRARYGEANYLILRYEDLVGDSEATISRIQKFLSIQGDPSLLRPSWVGGNVEWDSNSPNRDYSSITPKSLGKWKAFEEEHPSEIRLIERMLQKRMHHAGYSLQEGSDNGEIPIWELCYQEAAIRAKDFLHWIRGKKKGVY
jgi:hypothetical protein